MTKSLALYENQYEIVTDVLGIFHQESKNKIGTIIPVFGIEVNTKLFKVSLLANKINKAISIIAATPFKNFFVLKEI